MTKALKQLMSLRSMLSFVLMFWCAGAGCMMVSYARAATTESAGSMNQATAGGMSMDAHACCKARRSSSKQPHAHNASQPLSPDLELLTTPSMPTQTGVMNCCPLTSGSIAVSSRSQSNDRATVLQQPDSFQTSLFASHPAPLTVPLRLPNRALSYLLDCAFLI